MRKRQSKAAKKTKSIPDTTRTASTATTAGRKSLRKAGEGRDESNADAMDIDSGSESDGESALRKLKESEAAEACKGARRGPANESMQYFRDPVKCGPRQGF